MKNKKHNIRVATMTFHIAHNYGAMLQAYALEKAINKIGYNCEVLDYRFRYIDAWSGIQTWSDVVRQIGILKGTYEYLARVFKGYIRRQSILQSKFNKFMRKYLKLSREIYFSADELQNANYDVIILGSDQIWNPDLTNGIAKEYFGENFNLNTRISSYAASCGTKGYSTELSKEIIPLISRLKNISVRENSFAEYLRGHGLSAESVLDPVFLLKQEDWNKLIKKAPKLFDEPYLFLYAFDADNLIYDAARKIARERNLKIVSCVYKNDKQTNDIIQLSDCGPLDFLWLLKNASFVCTSSFHGEALSILFNKEFYCVGHPKYSQRNIDLLSIFNMTDRMINNLNDVDASSNYDYTQVNLIIKRKREDAFKFLTSAIEG